MKKLIAVVLVLALPCAAGAFFFSPGGSSGGGSGTTNADDLVSGTVGAARGGTNIDTSASTGTPYVDNGTWTIDNAATMRTNLGADNASNLSGGTLPAARIADNSITNDKILDETLDLAGSKFTGTLPKANGGWGASVASQSGIPYFVTGTVNWDTFAAFLARMGVTFNPADNSWTFGSITFDEATSTCVPADNNCGTTEINVGDPTGADLSAGLGWFDNTLNMRKQRNNDNSATLEVFTSGAAHTLNFATSGTLMGAVKVNSDADGMTGAEMTTAGVYGTLFLATGAGTWTLPTAAAGMALCLLDSGTAHDLILDIQAGDNVVLVGVEGADGVGITNASGSSLGDYVCVIAAVANKWYVMGKQGTWASQ